MGNLLKKITFSSVILLLGVTSLIHSMGSTPKPSSETLKPLTFEKIETPAQATYLLAQKPESIEKRDELLLQAALAMIPGENPEHIYHILLELQSIQTTHTFTRSYQKILIKVLQFNSVKNSSKYLDIFTLPVKKDVNLEFISLALIQENNPDQAMRLIPEISSNVIRSRIWQHIISYYAKQQDLEKATYLLNVVKSPTQKDKSLQSITLAYANKSNITSSNATFALIQSDKIKNETLSQLSVLHARSDQLELSFKRLTQINDTNIYEKTVINLVEFFATHQKYESAWQLSEGIQDAQKKEEAKTKLAISLAENKQFDMAKKLLNVLQVDKNYIAVLKVICEKLSENGLFDDALKLAKNEKDELIRSELLLAIAKSSAINTDYHHSWLQLQQVSPLELKHNVSSVFIGSFSKHASAAKVTGLLEQIKDKKTQEQTRILVIDTLIDSKKYPEALNFIQSLTNTGLQIEYEIKIIQHQALSPKPTLEKEFYTNLSQKLNLISDPIEQVQYSLILNTYEINQNFIVDIHPALKKNIIKLKNLPSSSKRNQLLSQLIIAQATWSDPSVALDWVHLLPNSYERAKVLALMPDITELDHNVRNQKLTKIIQISK